MAVPLESLIVLKTDILASQAAVVEVAVPLGIEVLQVVEMLVLLARELYHLEMDQLELVAPLTVVAEEEAAEALLVVVLETMD